MVAASSVPGFSPLQIGASNRNDTRFGGGKGQAICFSPLQIGASNRNLPRRSAATLRPVVSVPFRSGHLIVTIVGITDRTAMIGFSPLQIGASNRNRFGDGGPQGLDFVSVPFRSGHLIVTTRRSAPEAIAKMFQSPSDRGI